MKSKAYTPFLLLLFILAGCVTSQQQEQVIKDMQDQLADLKRAQVDTNVKLEELNNKLLLLQERVDVDSRAVEELKSMAVPLTPPEELRVVKLPAEGLKKEDVKKEESTVKTSSPEELYQQAQDVYTAGRLEEAVTRFNGFIQDYPQHHLADNARYWIGEVYYSRRDFQSAISEFQKVVDNYPNGNKAPEALLKIGFSYIELGEMEKAITTLKRLIKTYPSSDAAEKAKTKLKDLQR